MVASAAARVASSNDSLGSSDTSLGDTPPITQDDASCNGDASIDSDAAGSPSGASTSSDNMSDSSADESCREDTDLRDSSSWNEGPFTGEGCTCETGVTTGKALTLLVLFMLRHNLLMVAMTDLLVLINTLFGKPVVPTSLHLFERALRFCKDFATTYYCSLCCNVLDVTKKTGTCSVCKKAFDVSDRENVAMFLTASLKSQLRGLLESMTDLSFLTDRYNRKSGSLSDICDGEYYRSLSKDFSLLGNPLNISLSFNTDGCPVFKSKHYSTWPLQLTVNELSIFSHVSG